MAVYHLLYRTSVAGRIPTADNMPSGRLGLNLVDERIYFTNDSGAVVEPRKPFSILLPTVEHNLNTYVTPGDFYQGTTGIPLPDYNYPVLQQGFLTVEVFGSAIYQTYKTRTTVSQVFVRSRQGSGDASWGGWVQLAVGTSFTPQSTTTDTTPGRGLIVGAFGQGSYAPSLSEYGYSSDFNLIDDKSCLVTIDANMSNGPSGSASVAYTAMLRVQRRRYAAGTSVTQEVFLSTGAIWKRAGTGDIGSTAWSAWTRILDTSDLTSTLYNRVSINAASVDANSLIADQTYYTWTSGTLMSSGTNFPGGVSAAGYIRVVYQAATIISQELTTLVTGGKPRCFFRFGNSSTGVWQPWKCTSSFSSSASMPTQDCGDIYVDGAGWYRWTGSTYALANIGAPIVTNANTTIALTSIAPNTYTRTTSASPVSINISAGAASAPSEFHFRQAAGGVITFVPASGVTINPPFGGSLVTSGLGSTVTLKCVDTNVYDLFGVTSS